MHCSGRIGVWNSLAQHWQSQELAPVTAHDTAGSFLLLGSSNGSIHYIDMQKFPLRMKDNDLLVTELYRWVVFCLLRPCGSLSARVQEYWSGSVLFGLFIQ